MATVEQPVAVDGGESWIGSCSVRWKRVGATLNSALVVMGDKARPVPRARPGAGGLTPVELSRRTGRPRTLTWRGSG